MPKPTFYDFSEGRDNNFDLLRFALATLVIFSHCYPLMRQGGSEPLGRLTRGQADGGSIAVDFFFAISGFLIVRSWTRSASVRDYLKKRVLRIYPGFLVALLFGVVVIAPLGGMPLKSLVYQRDALQSIYRPLLFRHIVSVRGVFADNPSPGNINGSLWTIRFELACYLLVVLGGLLGMYQKRGVTLAVFAIALVFYQCWHQPITVPYFDHLEDFPRLLTFFLAGMTIYCYRTVIPYTWGLAALSLAALVLANSLGVLTWVMPICGVYLLFVAAFYPMPRARNFARRGDLSYGIYLYAYPVQQLLIQNLGPRLNPAALFLCALPLTCGLAALSWRFIESPFLKLKTKSKSMPPIYAVIEAEPQRETTQVGGRKAHPVKSGDL